MHREKRSFEFYALAAFFTLSLSIMVIVDGVIGQRAQYLNAFSVVQRLLGIQPMAGDSLVAQKIGAIGELCVVLLANILIGSLLTGFAMLFTRKRK